MNKRLRGTLFLLLAVFIWGSTFVAQSVGMDYIGPFTFATVRCSLAVLVLVPVTWLLELGKPGFWHRWTDPKLLRAGLFCGIALFAATTLQQIGLIYTDAGKSGFLTAMYIVLVPILGLALKRRVPASAWCGVVLAVAGLYLLSFAAGMHGINIGDVLTIGCAICFAVQIILIDLFGKDVDPIRLNTLQAACCGILSCIAMGLTEQPELGNILSCWFPLSYAGILSMGVAYTLQIIGQRDLNPTPASLIMSLEAVIAVIFGAIFLQETMTVTELCGCALVFFAVLLSQLPSKKN